MTKKRAQQLFKDYPEVVTARVYVTKFPKWAEVSDGYDCTYGYPFKSRNKMVWFHLQSPEKVEKLRRMK